MRARLVPLFLLALSAAPASAQKAKGAASKLPTPACNITYLPIVPGYQWDFKGRGPGGVAVGDVTVKIVSVQPGKGPDGRPATLIQAEEKFNGRVSTTSWSCTPAGGLIVSPESFFFAGEPGGGVGMTFKQNEHAGVSWVPDARLIADVGTLEEKVKAEVTRPATHGVQHEPALVEIQRLTTVKEQEGLEIPIGSFMAQRVQFDLRGSATVGEEKVVFPAKRSGSFYFVKNLGPIFVEDTLDRAWELQTTTVPVPGAPVVNN